MFIVCCYDSQYMYRDFKEKFYGFTYDIKKACKYKTEERAWNKVYKNLSSEHYYYGEECEDQVWIIEVDDKLNYIRQC